MPFKYSTPTARLAANSEFKSESCCWVWTGALNNAGRPVITIREPGRETPRKILVTRYIAQFIHGEPCPPVRKRYFKLHSCDEALCVNPEHNKRGTQKQNVRDAVERGRHKTQFGKRWCSFSGVPREQCHMCRHQIKHAKDWRTIYV